MRIQLDSTRTPLSLSETLSCGQTFRWRQKDDWWVGVVSEAVLKLRQSSSGTLEFKASADDVDAEFVRRYLRLDDNLPRIYAEINKDLFIREAVEKFYGLRLVRQEPWECLISYICATFKNIPAIKRMIQNLSSRFGVPIEFEGDMFYGFPECHALAEANLEELRLCGLGYRAVNVLKVAKIVDGGRLDLEHLKTVPYEFAKKALMSLPGVGPKAADCVLLFSLDKLEALPIDVWMRRILLEYYSEHFESEFIEKVKGGKGLSGADYQALCDFGRRYFGEYVGYAQEYLYHFKRCQTLRTLRRLKSAA